MHNQLFIEPQFSSNGAMAVSVTAQYIYIGRWIGVFQIGENV
jgi:hypothetical protein